MDLERCPRCGVAWSGGEKCRKCGFVPIGAGLQKPPKKKKRRHGKYVEPGSARGLLATILLGAIGYGAYAYQPWQDDWEMVRGWFGQGRHHSVVGDWEILKTVTLKKDKAVLSDYDRDKGKLSFSKGGKLTIDLMHGDDQTEGTGSYLVNGLDVVVSKLTASEAAAGALPPTLKLNLSWNGPDSIVATCNGSEAIFLRRMRFGASLVGFERMGVTAIKNSASGELRGIIGNVKEPSDGKGEN